jgi:hypothetical protein
VTRPPDGAAGAEVLQLVGTPRHITKAEFYAGVALGLARVARATRRYDPAGTGSTVD